MTFAEIMAELPSLTDSERTIVFCHALGIEFPTTAAPANALAELLQAGAEMPKLNEEPLESPLPAEGLLPDELIKAARNVENRFRFFGIRTYKEEIGLWDELSPDIRAKIPPEIISLLSNFKLMGGGLSYKFYHRAPYHALFSFYDARNFQRDDYGMLAQYGYLAFASAEGDEWLMTLADGPAGKIYFLSRSSWALIDEPTSECGLIYAHRNLASLLMCMGVSNCDLPNFSNHYLWGRP